MIQATINKTPYNIPTSWNDVSYKQWVSIQEEKDELKLLSILTNIPVELLANFSNGQINKLALAIQFVQTQPKLEEIKTDIDIRKYTYGQKILLQQLIEKNKDNIMPIIGSIVSLYSSNEYNENYQQLDVDGSLIEVYGKALNIINQLTQILEREKENLEVKPTIEQVQAGVDMFDKFGVMNTVKALALGNILNYEKILKLDYNTVYLHLLMSKTEHDFQENYRAILESKRK
jgi:hypothetical protein